MSAVMQQDRRHFLGGSDAAAAVNLSRYKSPLRLYQEKLGELEPDDLSDNERVHFGIVLEDVVATEFSRRTGIKVMREHRDLAHADHEFMVAHIDRRVVGEKEGLECKTADLRMAREWGEEGTDSIPMEYLAQCVHYMAVTGWKRWHVALLLGGNAFRTYTVDRDEELVESLVAREQEFWQCVQTKTPPAPTTLEDAKLLWPQDQGFSVNATEEIEAAVLALAGLKSTAKLTDMEIAEKQLEIEAYMGNATTLLGSNKRPLATWKTQQARRISPDMLRARFPEAAEACTTVSSSRVFRIK